MMSPADFRTYELFVFHLCFTSVEKKKRTCGFTGEAAAGENLSL